MKIEQMSASELIDQLLTTDYGGLSVKRSCLVRLLQDAALGQSALKILHHPSEQPLRNPNKPRDR